MIVEKRNLRPYILGLCFFWGLVLGFIVYSTTQSTAERTANEQALAQAQETARLQKIAAERQKSGATPTDNTKSVGKDVKPPITVTELAATKLETEEDEVKTAAQSKDWRSVPQVAKVVPNPAYGLTARTSPLPTPVDKLNIQEIMRRNAAGLAATIQPTVSKNSATGKSSQQSKPVAVPTSPASNIEDLPMPEID